MQRGTPKYAFIHRQKRIDSEKQKSVEFKTVPICMALTLPYLFFTFLQIVFNKTGIPTDFSTEKQACCKTFILQHALCFTENSVVLLLIKCFE